MKTLVLGIGNPILSDDGVGIHIVRELRKRVRKPGIDFEEASIAGLGILDLVRGFDRLFLVDAIQTEAGVPGTIYRLTLQDLCGKNTLHFAISHDIDIKTALEVGEKLGEHVPSEVIIYAVEAENLQDFSEECTRKVRDAIPLAVERIMHEI